MAAAHVLRKEIRKYIEDYMRRWGMDGTGDATISELIVMACVMSDEPLSIPEALGWMNRRSRNHPDLINNMLHNGMNQEEPIDLDDSIDESTYHLDKPGHWLDVVRRDHMGFRVPIQESKYFASTFWSSPIGNANVFLRRRLFPYACPSQHTHFRLMDLPAEVRELIFEYALLLPRSGVWYDLQTRYRSDGTSYRYAKAWTTDREVGLIEYSPSLWNTENHSPSYGDLLLRSLQSRIIADQTPVPGQALGSYVKPRTLFQVDLNVHLALLRVNKTVYKEALPHYYSQNFFYIPNDYDCQTFLEDFSGPRRQHFENIIWQWLAPCPPPIRLVQRLTALLRLRTLIVVPAANHDLSWERGGLQALSSSPLSQMSSLDESDRVALCAAIVSIENALPYAG